MDHYPEELAPDFEEGGAVSTPFEEWWRRALTYYGHVPEIVAKEWLHRHWGHSPYSWIPSHRYAFELAEWPSEKLAEIRTRHYDFALAPQRYVNRGKNLFEGTGQPEQGQRSWCWLRKYMYSEKKMPAPIVVLDNTDDHIRVSDFVPDNENDMPAAYIVLEGHNRLEYGHYLYSQGMFSENFELCLVRLT